MIDKDFIEENEDSIPPINYATINSLTDEELDSMVESNPEHRDELLIALLSKALVELAYGDLR